MFVATDENGRITATTDVEEFAQGMQEFDFPEDFDFSHQGDYTIQDGALVYDGAQTAEEQAAEAAAEAAKAIEDKKNAFFAPGGGKSKMEQDIKDAAASGGADPALANFATLAMPMVAPTAKDSALASMMKYAPLYVPEGHAYKKGEVFQTEGGDYYRCSKDFTSQSQWQPGGAGLESLFYRIEIAPDGIIVWSTVYGGYNAPDAGDLRHYPDANGPIYRSLLNDNAYSPEAFPANWELAQR